ncbi:acyl-CoA thioester hydrolase [Christiangramia gaetbulicola]|uniref:Acyl-CoA thioester hydrolase n=1 Tax=Christiangramia gaetbulicola TaxID=703340 RepID=A0A2T6AIX1_9FLAO|nr:thioesterase family protein [Christiangramia gaetbulicola]PTX43770.1 acyl-CoA thioester hydrolase [Christiangramia gaetbulicola]
MKSHKTLVKVRYAETDQMGVVHHGNYPQYLEIARLEWLSTLGISYKSMEEEGIMLPVYELNLKYIKPVTFDENITIETRLQKMPNVKIIFDYSVFNEQGELVTSATSTLVFMDSKTRRPVRCPQYILDKLKD